MKCFSHPEVDAVGLCTACNRGLCAECAVDMRRGLACKGRCEHEVRRLLDLRDYSFTQPHQYEASVKGMSRGRLRSGIINLALGGIFLLVWYIYGPVLFGVVGGASLLLGVLILATARPKVRTDQFRLCPKCGYNITGNTSGTCPECGYLV